MKCGWREGNQIQLLENGDQFYPAVFEAIAQAQQKIILETFILFEDEVGKKLHAALLKAAQRGVKPKYYSTATALPISATRLSAN